MSRKPQDVILERPAKTGASFNYEWEKKANQLEIDLATSFNRTDIADKLRENLEEERKFIYDER